MQQKIKNYIFFTLFNLQRVKTKHESKNKIITQLLSIKFPKLNLKYLHIKYLLSKMNRWNLKFNGQSIREKHTLMKYVFLGDGVHIPIAEKHTHTLFLYKKRFAKDIYSLKSI